MMTDRLLIVDDDQAMCEMLAQQLRKRGFGVNFYTTSEEALDSLSKEEYAAVVTDFHMPGMSGIELSERITANRPDVPVIVITSFGSMETAIAALRVGAYDFITKPFETEVLVHAINRAISHRRLSDEVKVLRMAVDKAEAFDEIRGTSPKMQKVFKLIEKAAKSNVTVLITGESGTGKELVARALHRHSQRKDGPFIAVNCAAMPETLLESELFGHAKGAFTDAKAHRKGLFVQSTGGVLFLDEIGDMPLGLQVKILRALEERSVRPVGGEEEVRFDARIVSATNRDLALSVEDRTFREDLYYRLNVIQIKMPPLRDRGRDIITLAQHFVDQFAEEMGVHVKGLTTAAAERLLTYSWPGNVRELKNSMEHAVALTACDQITVEDLPERIRRYDTSHVLVTGEHASELVSMDEVERRYISRVMAAVNGNKALAARILNFDRKTLYRKLERYKLDTPKPEGV
jgi:two-component system, NtrC family, response regulator AtoC